MNYIQPLKQIPAKSEIAEYVNQFKSLDNLSPILNKAGFTSCSPANLKEKK